MSIPKTISGVGIMGIAIVLKWQLPFLPFMTELFWAGAGMIGIGAAAKIDRVVHKKDAFKNEKETLQVIKNFTTLKKGDNKNEH